MVRDTLYHPVSELQKSHFTDRSWTVLVTHVLRLLKLYSTGLSLPVVVDHICSSQRTVSVVPSFRSARIDSIANSPNVWLISFDDGLQAAHFPHSLFISRVCIGMKFSILSNFPDPGLQSQAEIDALRLAKASLNKSLTGPIRNAPDITSVAQPAETPSQSDNFSPKTVSFPTLAVFFHLDTFPLAAFGVTDPVDSFTLQKVWSERSLHPLAVYSQVVSIDMSLEVARLQDCPQAQSTQPIVRCHFSGGRELLLQTLKPGCMLLLISPDVHPNGSSFDLSTNASTICVLSNNVNVDHNSHIKNELYLNERCLKRARNDRDLSKSTSPVYISSVLTLAHPELQPPLVVHARIAKPSHKESHHPNSWIVFVDTISVSIFESFDDLSQFMEGDEVLFTGFQIRKSSSTGWIAESVDNLSTSKALLYAPLFRNVVDSMTVRRYMREGALCSAHVCIRILNANKIDCRVRLQVKDAEFQGRVLDDEPWYVEVMDSNLNLVIPEARIHVGSKGNDPECHQLQENDNKAYLMTLICYGKKWSVPRVRSCIVATSAMLTQNLLKSPRQ